MVQHWPMVFFPCSCNANIHFPIKVFFFLQFSLVSKQSHFCTLFFAYFFLSHSFSLTFAHRTFSRSFTIRKQNVSQNIHRQTRQITCYWISSTEIDSIETRQWNNFGFHFAFDFLLLLLELFLFRSPSSSSADPFGQQLSDTVYLVNLIVLDLVWA